MWPGLVRLRTLMVFVPDVPDGEPGQAEVDLAVAVSVAADVANFESV